MDALGEACKGIISLDELLQFVHGVLKVRKGSYLFQEGTADEDIYIVKSGKIQLSKISEDGREVAVSLTSEGNVVGEVMFQSASTCHFFSAKAVEDSEVYVIKNVDLENAILQDGQVALKLMRLLSIAVRKQQTKLRDLVLNGKKGALYSTLIRLSNTYGKKTEQGILIDVSLTNQDLANYSVTTREGVNRMLQELINQQIISIEKGRKILIHNLAYLKKEIHCENCPVEFCNLE
ncbi:MAG: Crp/Fnr family transcriptional regulator [Bacillaceae bacterium]